MVAFEFGLERETAQLQVLRNTAWTRWSHRDRAAAVGGGECGVQRAVTDQAAGQPEVAREKTVINVVSSGCVLRQHPPNGPALVDAGKGNSIARSRLCRNASSIFLRRSVARMTALSERSIFRH